MKRHFAVLDCSHGNGAEIVPIFHSCHLVNDIRCGLRGTHKVTVEGVEEERGIKVRNTQPSRHQCLAHHLATIERSRGTGLP